MEIKIKKDKSTKKRKAAESSEDSIKSMTTSAQRAQSTAEPCSSDKTTEDPPRKKRKALVEEIEVDITKPEPPSKKALRRLKKGKPLPPSKSGADSTPEPDTEKAKKPEVEKRSEYGIWIGNLPWSCTKADLRTFLASNSDIVDETITRIHMPSPDDGKSANKVEESKPWKKQHNKGYAYVDFSVPEAVQQAVALSEQLLSGRRVLIKDAKSFEGRPQKTKEESRNDGKLPSKRIFVGNLRFDTTEDSLKEHFERCGAVEHVMVATFEDSGKCKGYGWVTFQDLEAAEAAVRGYVIEEEKEDDRENEEGDSNSDDSNDAKEDQSGDEKMPDAAVLEKPQKPRFSFVDKINKRPVRREFAEDAQVRYKKRYGKDGTKAKNGVSTASNGDIDFGAERPGAEKIVKEKTAEKIKLIKQVEYRTPYAARLTGGIIASKGKRVVF